MEEAEKTMKMFIAARRKAAAATTVAAAQDALNDLVIVQRRAEIHASATTNPKIRSFLRDLQVEAEPYILKCRMLIPSAPRARSPQAPAATASAASAAAAAASAASRAPLASPGPGTRPATASAAPAGPHAQMPALHAVLGDSAAAPSPSVTSSSDSYYMRIVRQAVGAREILEQCRRSRQRFSDGLFPPCTASLFKGAAPHRSAQGVAARAVWCRPPQGAVAITSAARPGDVIQGALGDCWFLGALSLAATKPECLAALLPLCDPEMGFYVVRFFRNRTRVDVVVDDALPYDKFKNEPIFGRNRNPQELWVSIIEKAYAKVCGSYYSMETGNESDGLVDLTGGVSFTLMLNERGTATAEQVWKLLCSYQARGYLMGCANNRQEQVLGIVPNHAYGILGLYDIPTVSMGTVLLVRVRNPWGDVEWKGAWSDNSPQWGLVHPSIKAQIGYSNAEDGTFFMSFEDFGRHFEKVYLCKDVPQGWSSVSVQGSWVPGRTAGGCLNYPSWVYNPQYLVSVTRPTQGFLVLSQGDFRKYGAEGGYDAAIGMTLLRRAEGTPAPPESLRRVCPPDVSEIVERTAFVATRERSVAVSLDPRHSPYHLVPATFEPACFANFKVTLFAEASCGASIVPCAEWPVRRELCGIWASDCSGGWDEYDINPQFELRCSGLALLRLDAVCDKGEQPPAVGIVVTDGDGVVVAQTALLRERAVGLYVTAQATAAPLSVYPCTHERGWLGQFNISLYTSDVTSSLTPPAY
eukprot:m51a1_g10504 putative calpain-9 isoform 1 (753) ;mRNA; f:148142-151278